MTKPEIVRTVVELRSRIQAFRAAGERVALVPTMGALHAGHLALVAQAGGAAGRVVVSIFVNPAQFAPGEDLATYPRDLDADLAALSGHGVDLVYAPELGEMYLPDGATAVSVGGPSQGLESAFRPHFFTGVATVVSKLLIQCAPDVAVFGEKDFQQLAVIRRLVADLAIPVEIVGGETVREPDGLAMSSRNVYLSLEDRAKAPRLHAALSAASRSIASGGNPEEAVAVSTVDLQQAGFVVDYLELRDGATLGAFDASSSGPGRLLAAARLGGVRLIDNVAVTKPD